MLIPDSIVTFFAVLDAGQIREVVNAVRAYQGGEEVTLESMTPLVATIFGNAMAELEEEKNRVQEEIRRKEDLAEKRRLAAAKSHEKRLANKLQKIAKDDFANICNSKKLQTIANATFANEAIDNINNNISQDSVTKDSLTEDNDSTLFPSNQEETNSRKENSQRKDTSAKKSDEEKFLDSLEDKRFAEPLKMWFKYKREKKQTYKPTGMKMCLNELMKLSEGDPVKAQEIVNFSIARNYAGLFAPRENTQAQAQPTHATYIPYDNEKAKDVFSKYKNPYATNK